MQWGVNNVQLGGRGGGAKAGRRLGGINDLLLTVLKKFQNIKMAQKCSPLGNCSGGILCRFSLQLTIFKSVSSLFSRNSGGTQS